MGDRFGYRRVLTRIVIWWSAFTCLTGLVTGYPMLFVTQLLFGAGEAAPIPTLRAASASALRSRRRGPRDWCGLPAGLGSPSVRCS